MTEEEPFNRPIDDIDLEIASVQHTIISLDNHLKLLRSHRRKALALIQKENATKGKEYYDFPVLVDSVEFRSSSIRENRRRAAIRQMVTKLAKREKNRLKKETSPDA